MLIWLSSKSLVCSYIIRIYAAPSRCRHLYSLFSVVDLISLLPMCVEIALSNEELASMRNIPAKRQFLSLLQAAKSLRILRAYRVLKFIQSTVQRQIVATLLTVICIIIAMACVLQIVEQCAVQCPTYCQIDDRHTGSCMDISDCNALDVLFYCCKCQDLKFFDWIYFVIVSSRMWHSFVLDV